MPERLKAILDKITAWWKKFNTKQRSVLISIVAVVIVALVILGVVISRPTQVELVEAQSASEASTIKGVLEDNNISYEVDSKLVFFVNKSDEVNAIMALGDNGIPAQAYSIDNVTDGSFSTTEADKQKKYQVYLEDKLKDHLEKHEVLKSKIHCARVTEANLNYMGSITIDEDLMDAANMIAGEKVYIADNNNGERFETYIIKGERGSGKICLNGAAARKVQPDDIVIIMSYALMDFEEAKSFKPTVIFPDPATNKVVK